MLTTCSPNRGNEADNKWVRAKNNWGKSILNDIRPKLDFVVEKQYLFYGAYFWKKQFYIIFSLTLRKLVKKCQNLIFNVNYQCQFPMSKIIWMIRIIRIFMIFFVSNVNIGKLFVFFNWVFLTTSIFWNSLFS